MFINIIVIDNEYVMVNNWVIIWLVVLSLFVYMLLFSSFFKSIMRDFVRFEQVDILFLNRRVFNCVYVRIVVVNIIEYENRCFNVDFMVYVK